MKRREILQSKVCAESCVAVLQALGFEASCERVESMDECYRDQLRVAWSIKARITDSYNVDHTGPMTDEFCGRIVKRTLVCQASMAKSTEAIRLWQVQAREKYRNEAQVH